MSPPTERSRPWAGAAPNEKTSGDGLSGANRLPRGLVLDLDHFRARLLQDALTEALAATWLRRAELFEWAAPRPGDYVGGATPQQLAEAATRCGATARVCRWHAELILSGRPEPISAEVESVLAEVA
jgi:hypothetical protein